MVTYRLQIDNFLTGFANRQDWSAFYMPMLDGKWSNLVESLGKANLGKIAGKQDENGD